MRTNSIREDRAPGSAVDATSTNRLKTRDLTFCGN
jgi:hypothetical protein